MLISRRLLARSAAATLALLAALAAPALARAPGEVNVFAWEVRPAGLPAGAPADLLIGTMHVAVPAGKHLPAAVLTRVSAGTHFIMEADLEHANPAAMAPYLRLAAGQPDLSQQLKPKQWAELKQLAAARNIQPEVVSHLTPWFVSMLLLDLDTAKGEMIDERLRTISDAAHIPASFLETADEQFQTLRAVSDKESLGQLAEDLDDPGQSKRELAELETAYMSGDLKAINNLMFGADKLKEYPDFYAKLFWERNARWVPKVETAFAQGGAVVAVGLGHMLGDRGLVARLQHDGAVVTPLAL